MAAETENETAHEGHPECPCDLCQRWRGMDVEQKLDCLRVLLKDVMEVCAVVVEHQTAHIGPLQAALHYSRAGAVALAEGDRDGHRAALHMGRLAFQTGMQLSLDQALEMQETGARLGIFEPEPLKALVVEVEAGPASPPE